jgi:hypothetical protein
MFWVESIYYAGQDDEKLDEKVFGQLIGQRLN